VQGTVSLRTIKPIPRRDVLATLEMLERIRTHLSRLAGRDVPIHLSSGYRSLAVNRAIGSDDTSDHRTADAADWTAPAFGSPFQICRALAPHVSTLGIGQLINEYGDWVHAGRNAPAKAINRIITYSGRGALVGIVEV
jgi:hypothetical protein